MARSPQRRIYDHYLWGQSPSTSAGNAIEVAQSPSTSAGNAIEVAQSPSTSAGNAIEVAQSPSTSAGNAIEVAQSPTQIVADPSQQRTMTSEPEDSIVWPFPLTRQCVGRPETLLHSL